MSDKGLLKEKNLLKRCTFDSASCALKSKLFHGSRLKSYICQIDADLYSGKSGFMKSHIFISVGLVIAAIFFIRGLEAVAAPGLGLGELYVLGGFCVAGALIRAGWKERKATKDP